MTLEGVNPVVFNADKTGRQAAFAQSIMDSTGGLFEEIIDIEAAGRRRLDDGAAGVVISYTGIARIDGTDNGEQVSADLLEQSMDALTLAIDDGSFLTALQAADSRFASVTVDETATYAAIAAATVVFVVTTPAPSPRPTLWPSTAPSLRPTLVPTTIQHRTGSYDPDVVLCPGFDHGEFCDCCGNCDGNRDWCECAEAQACCSDSSCEDDNSDDNSLVVILCVVSAILVIMLCVSLAFVKGKFGSCPCLAKHKKKRALPEPTAPPMSPGMALVPVKAEMMAEATAVVAAEAPNLPPGHITGAEAAALMAEGELPPQPPEGYGASTLQRLAFWREPTEVLAEEPPPPPEAEFEPEI